MKRILLSLFSLLFSFFCLAQDVTGDWNGLLNAMGQELPIVLHIESTDTGYTGTMDSPKQKAMGMELNTVSFEENVFKIGMTRLNITYEGSLQDDGDIKGTFKQNGIEFPLNFYRGEAKAVALNRPQEPKAPFPYNQEEVTFVNPDGGHSMAGTLTLPKVLFKGKKKLAAVILISGSGPQDRDEALLGHKPFLVLADYLTRQGIAVLRYDDRGTAESGGSFSNATSADFATDAEAAFQFLKNHPDINASKIGFAGHSEGGLIAPIVAAANQEVAFIALLAGVGMPGDELLIEQGYLIGKVQGMSEDDLAKNRIAQGVIYNIIKKHRGDTPLIKEKASTYLKNAIAENPEMLPEGTSLEELLEQQLGMVTSDWFQYLIATDPAATLGKVKCPVLAINGSLDLQVPAKQNLEGIEKSVKKGGNNDVTIAEIPNLNHLFQTTETGDPAEYATIEETFSPIALAIIGDWIKAKTK